MGSSSGAIPTEAAIAAALLPERWGVLADCHWPNVVDGPLSASSVLLPLLPHEEGWRLVLIRRSEQVAVHRGQIAFPGGRRDPGDRDDLAVALRETEEELAIPSEKIRVLGALPPHATHTSGFLIHPFVGILESSAWRPAVDEVAAVITTPLAPLLAPGACREKVAFKGNRPVIQYIYPIDEGDIWGATAAILHAFAQLCRQAVSTASMV